MLAIKLQRIGRKHQPSYRLVVAEKRTKMAAPPVEDLGSYEPRAKAAAFKKDRISYWLGVGAQPTVTVHNLLVAQGIMSAAKKAVKMKKAERVVEAVMGTAPAAETSAASQAAEPTASAEPASETKTEESAPSEQPAA